MLSMKFWPVPESRPEDLGNERSSGFFWENRGDRRHCGVDIYAPEGSRVLAIEDGEVLDVGIFTSNGKVSYWNTTYYVLLQKQTGIIGKYAELREALVRPGEHVQAGDLIGHVGSVLNPERVFDDSPDYIKSLVQHNRHSMLHFELYRKGAGEPSLYSGGNVFTHEMPDHLMDPTDYLRAVLRG
jgi:murein DD-endopeptidase MepM/ murein hydrolase activator NlpD